MKTDKGAETLKHGSMIVAACGDRILAITCSYIFWMFVFEGNRKSTNKGKLHQAFCILFSSFWILDSYNKKKELL